MNDFIFVIASEAFEVKFKVFPVQKYSKCDFWRFFKDCLKLPRLLRAVFPTDYSAPKSQIHKKFSISVNFEDFCLTLYPSCASQSSYALTHSNTGVAAVIARRRRRDKMRSSTFFHYFNGIVVLAVID